MKRQQAFSLIELSIVILVIGILIAGVIQGRDLISKVRLQTARSLTTSSPVPSIKGLELWLETTSGDSFSAASYPDNGSRIALWKDINPQKIVKNDATQATSGLQPSFTANAINGLPSLSFSGFQILNGTYPVISSNSGTGSFTFFLVTTTHNNANYQTAFDTGSWDNKGWVFSKLQSIWSSYLVPSTCSGSACDGRSTTITMSPNVSYVFSMTFNDSFRMDVYRNGTRVFNNTISNLSAAPSTVYAVGNNKVWINAGGSAPWAGHIGEIIVYDHSLSDADRKSVEKYLGQKWGNKISE